MKFQIGTVTSNIDVTRTGLLKVAFTLQDNEVSQNEWVRYVTPYGNKQAAFLAIPEPGSTVLCAFQDSGSDDELMRGYFYMGSVMGINSTEGRLLDPSRDKAYAEQTGEMPMYPEGAQVGGAYTSSEQIEPGLYGPSTRQNEFAEIQEDARSPFPDVFKGLYDAKGFTPEMIGLTGLRSEPIVRKGHTKII